jgi:hypothetical protein
MRHPPEPPSFDDDSLAEELLAAKSDLTDFENDDEPFHSALMDDGPDIPDEPFDFAGPYEPAEPDPDVLGEEEDAGPDLVTAGDARRYAENLTVLEDDDDSDEAARFLTYRNYVGALALILREQCGDAPWRPLAKTVRDLPGVRRIQRRGLTDLDRKRAARELRGAWAYELSMSPPSELFAIDVPDLVMIANHTAGVHAHYAIYKMCRALALALGMPMPEEHERHLDVVEQQFLRRGLLPSPWDARCANGSAPRSRKRAAHVFQAFPSGTSTCPNLWRPSTDTMWSLLATALKTTRDRSRGFESDLDNWRRQNRSKAAKAGRTKGHKRWVPYDVQDGIYAAMRPTNVLDFVYRMRRRSSYLDDSSFLNNRIGMQDAIGFNRDLLLFTRSTLHVLETLLERAAADDFLLRTQETFAKRTNPTLLNWTFASRDR